MCGIFGIISESKINIKDLNVLVKHSKQRGQDSSGLITFSDNQYNVYRADYNVDKLKRKVALDETNVIFGHSRLITNGQEDNQPVVKKNLMTIHNGIIVNDDSIWSELSSKRELKIDSEVILGIVEDELDNGTQVNDLSKKVLSRCLGVISCALFIPEIGKVVLFSNNGSLYLGDKDGTKYFASESYALNLLGCNDVEQIINECLVLDIPTSKQSMKVQDFKGREVDLVPELKFRPEEALLEYHKHDLKRCTKCILPETMPYIKFDNDGVCNYCNNYKLRNVPKPKDNLFELVKPYRRPGNQLDCLVPFSGGRDSCYSLHLIVNELKMKPITYTYDWGMVTDLGRRNISRMCSQLGVENIIVAADITKKRKNISMNLKAWLKSPHLGMMSILTAGDKHFFRYLERIKQQTGINLNMWGANPLEVTHFKTGFLGIAPDFAQEQVYSNGLMKQIHYQRKRFGAMMDSPSYFNSSLWDTLSGEYHRSCTKKQDYYQVYDYWHWDENIIDSTLLNEYDWEKAIDTDTTWRIGDGTAAFYNYVYYTVAGFTEHDTFRSNQIREGDITREEALALVEKENRPRYPNIRWYLDTLGIDFKEAIDIVNKIPKMYKV
ncbi:MULTISPECIES: glucosamine 6-phosphate synthetase [Vibrio]|uniref:glucosamine 6-phosphate synthetase n=1 Tax=Vibrio TaxID=662 RepID=UPI00148207BC|nr:MULTISPECIES: glucosamine 6-phosphate synthetase [Vibrio]MDE1264195.1 glucosamine 6-phosphate synthetase [Vibrio aestuarianus]MDE1296036.1 glucosamine 6-phosphate synthetase [Vibrio aestuarianus]MDE1327127.1 glucosamine 6-phosphate synthetase [Vibrio aestuarianus]NNN70322.1 glucosamine 6-phosphate synthetase [Vibrio sp. 3-2(1)]